MQGWTIVLLGMVDQLVRLAGMFIAPRKAVAVRVREFPQPAFC